MSWKINPEWLALEGKPHFVLAISQPDAFRELRCGPPPEGHAELDDDALPEDQHEDEVEQEQSEAGELEDE